MARIVVEPVSTTPIAEEWGVELAGSSIRSRRSDAHLALIGYHEVCKVWGNWSPDGGLVVRLEEKPFDLNAPMIQIGRAVLEKKDNSYFLYLSEWSTSVVERALETIASGVGFDPFERLWNGEIPSEKTIASDTDGVLDTLNSKLNDAQAKQLEIEKGLQKIIVERSELFRQKKELEAAPELTLDQIHIQDDNIKSLVAKDGFLYVNYHPLTMFVDNGEEVDLGRIVAKIDFRRSEIVTRNLDKVRTSYNNRFAGHPHAIHHVGNGWSEMCWGNFATPITETLKARDITAVVHLLTQFLKSCNAEDSAGATYSLWELTNEEWSKR